MTDEEIQLARKLLTRLSPLDKGPNGDLMRRYLRWKVFSYQGGGTGRRGGTPLSDNAPRRTAEPRCRAMCRAGGADF